MTDERDLVQPEGVNAGSAAAMRDAGSSGDPVPGGAPERAEEQEPAEPAHDLIGPPPDPDEAAAYGSKAAGAP